MEMEGVMVDKGRINADGSDPRRMLPARLEAKKACYSEIVTDTRQGGEIEDESSICMCVWMIC
jgi:hypothetical protein